MDLTTTSTVEDMMKYLVFESELNKLIKYCPDCGSIITDISKTVTGSALSISYSCILGHNKTWHSQPVIRHMPAGNLLLSAAILLSGSTFAKTAKFATILRMPIPSKSEFYKIQRAYLIPVINDYWTIHQTAILSVLSSCEPLHICGDGRSDSPGFSAKYTSYTIMDMTTSLIIDQQLVSLADDDISSSVAMETEALDNVVNVGWQMTSRSVLGSNKLQVT